MDGASKDEAIKQVLEAENLIKTANKIADKFKGLKSSTPEYGVVVKESVKSTKFIMNKYGMDNFSAYNLAGRKSQLRALLTGYAPQVGFQSKNSTGFYGIEA